MALFETWLKSDLKKPLKVEQLKGNLFSSDNGGNQIGVEVLDNGSPATLTGGVMGYVIRADGATVAVNGSLSGNRASIVLPSSAYVVAGQVSIAIKVGSTTVGACSAYVYRTTTDSLVDPGHVIPSIEELLAKIADCEAATTAANTAATLANTKAGLADEKATLANTKASLADEKATLADQKATLANTAATAANAAAQKIDGMTVGASGLPAGSSPTAVVSEVSGHKHVAFGIPKGDTGVTPDITIGDVETLLPGEEVYVELDESSTPEEPVLNIGIPKGDPGSITNAFATNIPMSPTDPTTIKEAMDEKMDEPETAGTEGQVLTSDGEGGQVWKDMSLDKYREASGSIVHVEDAVAEPVKSLEIEIAFAQDLHGYDHPWVGGAGKNLCDKDDENIRVKLYVEQSTGKAKSSASLNQPYRSVLLPCKPSTAYTVSNTKDIIIRIASFTGVPSDDTSATEKNAPSSATTAGTGLTITTGASDAYLLVQALANSDVTGGETTETALAGLMVEEGSTAHAWEPYANICPITGWTGCEVTVANGDDPTATGYEDEEYTVEFPTEADPVYGGTLTVYKDGTGKLVVDRLSETIPEFESITQGTSMQYVAFNPSLTIDPSNSKVVVFGERVRGITYNDRNSAVRYDAYRRNTSPRLMIKAGDLGEEVSVTELNSKIAGSKVVYLLANPITYNLTAVEVVRMLKGINFLSANTGKILSVLYPINEYVQTEDLEAGLNTRVDKNQGTQNAGKALGINAQGMVEPVPFSGDDFTGATSSTAGVHGYVPAPAAGDQDKILMGDGTWSDEIPERLEAVENVCTDTTVTIAVSDWESETDGYSYTWESNLVTSASEVEVFLRDGAEGAGIEEFDYEKVTGGVQFTTSVLPTGNLPVTIRVINARADAFQSLTGEDIGTDVIPGADNVDEALGVLGGIIDKLTSSEWQIFSDLVSTTQTAINPVSGRSLADFELLMIAVYDDNYIRTSCIIPKILFETRAASLSWVNSVNTQKWVEVTYVSDTSVKYQKSSSASEDIRCIVYGIGSNTYPA